MKRAFVIIATIILLAPALGARAGGSCCVEIQPNSSTVLSCTKMIDSCPTGTTLIDCSFDAKCSTFATADPAPVPDLMCCVASYDDHICLLKTGECRSDTTPVTCKSKPACEQYLTSQTPAPAPSTPSKAEYPIIAPRIPLNIPTVNLQEFLNVKQEEGYLYIPFISVFLVGAYKLGIGIAAILAVIMIMIGGFIWIAAGGDSGQIGKAKTMISSATVGLLLTFGSYAVLQLVNPDLVNFTALKIPTVGMQTIEIIDDYNPETIAEPTAVSGAIVSPSQYDAIFAKYAPCAGVEAQVLKAIAIAESGLNAGKTNPSGYMGLFQTKPGNCPSRVAQYCTDLLNPDNNTAAGSAMIKKSVDLIRSVCPNASAHDQMVMIYVSHNMGYGMLQTVVKGGCNVPAMRQAAINAYSTKWPGTAESYSKKYQPACLNAGKSAAECTGGPKFDYAVRTADRSGATQVLATSSTGVCPY